MTDTFLSLELVKLLKEKVFDYPVSYLAAKWLREVHGIHVMVFPDWKDEDLSVHNQKWYYNIIVLRKNDITHDFGYSEVTFDSHDLALEAGIMEAVQQLPNKQ